jgi:hypothetical protein
MPLLLAVVLLPEVDLIRRFATDDVGVVLGIGLHQRPADNVARREAACRSNVTTSFSAERPELVRGLVHDLDTRFKEFDLELISVWWPRR